MSIDGLTLIVGDSNKGKSSIFRALRGVLRNDIPADSVRNGQDGKVEVVVELPGIDPISAARTRKGSTKYEIGKDEKGKPVEFKALGDSIPEPMRVLGFGKVRLGDTIMDPVFSEQNRAQFLIDPEVWKPTDLNAVLGAFSSTEKLDAGKRGANLRIAQRSIEAKTLAEEIRDSEERKGRLLVLSEEAGSLAAWADGFEHRVGHCESRASLVADILFGMGKTASLKRLASGIAVPDMGIPEGLRRKADAAAGAAYCSRRLGFLSGLDSTGTSVLALWDSAARQVKLLQASVSLLGMLGKGLRPRACSERLGAFLTDAEALLSSMSRLSSVIRMSGGVQGARQSAEAKEEELRRTEASIEQQSAETAGIEASLAEAARPRCPVHNVDLVCPLCLPAEKQYLET